MPAGALQEALNASDDMKAIMGLHDASLGARSNETSGRAIMARQREGDVSTFHYIDNLSRAIRHAGRILIDLIPRVYSTPRMIRVLGPEGKPGLARIQPGTRPTQPEGVERIYDLSVGKYDLTVRAGPSFTSRREEAANQMLELVRAFPPVAPVVGDLLARNLDWPGAEEIAERMAALLPPGVKGEDPQVSQLTARLQALGQELAALKADRSAEARKLEIAAFEAETDRMKLATGA